MTLLAVDTASRRHALCVLASDAGALLAEQRLEGRHLDRGLPGALAALLAQGRPAGVAAVLGPGSYTGLRVGIGAALGLAHAGDLPLFGIGALDVVARAAPHDAERIEAVADAGRGALYVARFRRAGDELRVADEPRRVETDGWHPAPDHVSVSFDEVAGALCCQAQAAAALALSAAVAARGTPLPRAGLEPVYLGGEGSALQGPRV